MGKNGQNTEAKQRQLAHLRPPWPKGVSGNPGGRPKRDMAAEICRGAIEDNAEAIYKAVVKRLKSGDPRSFTAYADRGYGKAPESITVNATVEHRDLSSLSDDELATVAAIIESAESGRHSG